MTNLLQFTINVRKSHRQLRCTLQLVCKDRLLFVSVYIHVPLCVQLNPKGKGPNRLVYPIFFLQNSLFFHLHKQKSNGVRPEYSNSSISVTIWNYTQTHANLFPHNELPQY